MEKQLDLSLASVYDIECDKDKTLNSTITCTYLNSTGGTELFDFTSYTGATLTIKNSAGTILMIFTVSGGSITLYGTTGKFKLLKTSTEMNFIRSGEYNYDMILSSVVYPKRAFLRGKIFFIQNITN
jgi:hypothetical protein